MAVLSEAAALWGAFASAANGLDQLLAGTLTAQSGDAGLSALTTWLSATYVRAPTLVLGLAALLALPSLMLLGLLMRRGAARQTGEHTRIYRPSRRGERISRDDFEAAPQWPATAWIEAPGGTRHDVGAGMLRLGRDDDNDICLPDKTVHRYHAAIHRTDDAEYLITDLSSAGGNGVLVNGIRVGEAQLQDGDTIDLGQTRLKFMSRPA